MTLYYNKTSEKGKRRFLRSHTTRPEVIIWLRLKSKQILGYKFRRQREVWDEVGTINPTNPTSRIPYPPVSHILYP